MELDSSSPVKFSRHLIATNVAFKVLLFYAALSY
jgi:hypothetical protein